MPAPPFGTASAYADSFPAPPPRHLTISAETCFNLNMFKETVRQYRKLDDQIITRLNRAQAQLRDQTRYSKTTSSDEVEGMCARIWGEMMAGWAHRQTMLSYCIRTVSQSVEIQKPLSLSGADERLVGIPPTQRSGRGWKEDEVIVNQLANEEYIEAIVRKRTLDAFKSRCPYFTPHDAASKEWWSLADSGQVGKGPDIP